MHFCALALAALLSLPGLQQSEHDEVPRGIAALIPEAIEKGELEAARGMLREAVEALEEPLVGEELDHITFLVELDQIAKELGSLQEQRVLRGSILHLQARRLPPDHRDILAVKLNLALTLKALGDIHGARELEEDVLERWTRLLPPDHPELLAAKQNLAGTRYALGDIIGANELFEDVLERRTRLLPSDHPDLLAVKLNLAVTRFALGDIIGANGLCEDVLERRTRLLPSDHPDLLAAKQNLAATRKALGDINGARELEEDVLERCTRLLPSDHPDLLLAKLGLAGTRKALGDLNGARELEEDVLERRTRLLPSDHPSLLAAKQGLANTRRQLGDIAGARELEEDVLERRTRLLSSDHPDLLAAKLNLAATRAELGDINGARELEEDVLERWTPLLPSDHPGLLVVKLNLAATRYALGDIIGANELLEAVLERTRLLPSDHPLLLAAKQELAVTRRELGDLNGARELVASLLAGMRVRADALRVEAARPAREGARAELQRFSPALFLSAAADPEHTLEPELFATLESLRLASVASSEAAQALAARPELAQEARVVAEVRSRLNDLAAAGPKDQGAAEEWRRSLLSLTEERDRAERLLRAKLAETGAFVGDIEADLVGGRLSPGSAAVSFLRFAREFEKDPETKVTPPSVDSLLAFVVQPGGAVRRVEIGAASEVEALVGEWRAALGRPLLGRGISAARIGSEKADLESPGKRLRERVLGPVLAVCGDVRALHVELDDVLYLVPLDALPLDGGLVGERIAIHVEATLARLIRPQREVDSGGGLTLAGGIDYDAEPGQGPPKSQVASTPPLEKGGVRSGASSAAFAFLPGTEAESRSIAELYDSISDQEPVFLSGEAATKNALLASAPKTRWLHLATHGWFASESFKSQLDSLAEQSARDAFQRAETTLTGFAPETLCGLALAGANRGKDALGRVPGILTAEELASFDLRNCELAVLSACETNVGIRRAGQGIQSLQTALHAAGARTAITSLWKVDDAATRRLFELFYTKLWKEKLGKHDALWQAKMALRAEGHPPRDWAGWVLSGDPN